MPDSENPPLHERVASIILAGGQGTRLYPLTEHRCKPGVCFGGRYRLIDIPISNSLNSQIQQMFVLSQYFASDLQQHLSDAYPHSFLQKGHLEMLCPEETPQGISWFLGTADAVRKNMVHLEQLPVDYYLILSGDQLYHIDLLQMVRFAEEKNADLVIATISVQEQEAKRMGLLKTDKNQCIIDFFEKPQDPTILRDFCISNKNSQKEPSQYLGSMGIYVFKKKALLHLLQKNGHDFGKDLIPVKIQEGNSYAFIYEGYWEDIGTVASYYQANLALTKQINCLDLYNVQTPIYTTPSHLPSPLIKGSLIQQSIISQACIIEAKEISNSLIGIKSHIGKDSVIRDSIIMGNHCKLGKSETILTTVGTNCLLQKVIVDEQAFIGNHVTLTNTKQHTHYDGDGLFIRDGIIIIASGTRIPDHFTL